MNHIDRDELKELRALFPHAAKRIYFNHAAVSPLSRRVTDGINAFLDARSSGWIDDFEHCLSVIRETKDLLASLIGADSRDIALLKNTSEGLNVIANGLDWHEGDRVLLNDREFPVNVYPFLNLRDRGVEVDFAKCADGRIELETLEKSISDRTRLLSISHVSFLSGFRVDLQRLTSLCREHEVRLSVDAIQSVGAVKIDVTGCGIDFLSCGGHKWLMSPLGTGLLYVRRELLDVIRQAYVSWLSMKNPFDFLRYEQDLRDDAGRFEYSAQNFMGIVGMREAVRLILEVGVEKIEAHIFSLLDYLSEHLSTMGVEVLSSFPQSERSGILQFLVPDACGLAGKLALENITVSVREGTIRVSPHFYNSPEEMETFISTLRRFL